MKQKLQNIWNAMPDMIESVVKTIHPDDCSMRRFIATAYFINWLYLLAIIYSIIVSENPRANADLVAVATLLSTAIWAIFCSPMSIGVYFMGLFMANVPTTSL